MSTKDTKVLDQQRQRRNRINRMKNGIVLTIAVWMIVSLLAIIFLSGCESESSGRPAYRRAE